MSAQEGLGVKGRLVSFATFVWNHREKKFLGRGARSWAEIGVFYLIYYTCLASFFIGVMSVFYKTLDDSQPRLQGHSSLLKGNPGMGFKPKPDLENTLIRFQPGVTYQAHVDNIADTLKPYLEAEEAGEQAGKECTPDDTAEAGEACRFNVSSLIQQCNPDNNFGYGEQNQPCVLLRLNKIFGWMPEKFTNQTIQQAGVSEGLQKKILKDPDMIYIDCVGENAADRDNLGEIRYFPEQGFRHHYYPFTKQTGYQPPLVFVKFLNPADHIALMVECRALAPNIQYDRTEKEGGVHFELLVDRVVL